MDIPQFYCCFYIIQSDMDYCERIFFFLPPYYTIRIIHIQAEDSQGTGESVGSRNGH